MGREERRGRSKEEGRRVTALFYNNSCAKPQPLSLGLGARDRGTSSIIDGASTLRPSVICPGYSGAAI